MLENVYVRKISTLFRSIYNCKMDHLLRTESGEGHAKIRPEELIAKHVNIKNALNHYDNLSTGLKSLTLLSTLQYLGEL